MDERIREISRKVRKEPLAKDELMSLFDETTRILGEIGDLRSNYPKEYKDKGFHKKSALWSIRNSIRYRLKNLEL